LHPHPPSRSFVANKRLTAIRPDGRPSGQSLFSRSFDLESRSIFSAVPIADFTLWLIAKAFMIAALPEAEFAEFSKTKSSLRLGGWLSGENRPLPNAIISLLIRPCKTNPTTTYP
jgi:hypothetical protein